MSCKNPRGRGSLRGGWCNKMVGELGIHSGGLFYFFFIFFYYVIVCNAWDTMTQKESAG